MKAFKYHDVVISQEDADYAESIGLTKETIQKRINRKSMSIHDLTRKPPFRGGRHKQENHGDFIPVNKLDGGLITYHMSREEIVKKYGEPGKVMYPERLKNNSHWG
jgi:hypothetical protein